MRCIGYAGKCKTPVILHTDSVSPNVIGGRILDDSETIALVMADGNMMLLPIGGVLPKTLDEAMDARDAETMLDRGYLYGAIAIPAIERARAAATDREDDHDAM